VVAELEAAWAGYRARGLQAFAVEDCDPVFKDVYAMQAELWQQCFDLLAVGRSVAEVQAACQDAAERVVPAGGRFEKPRGELVLLGAGLGGDLPWVSGPVAEGEAEDVLVAGWAFCLAPRLRVDVGGRSYQGMWGDTVVLTEAGPRRLGARLPGLAIAGD
jgi:Xaa-Pro aminopeptidase